MEKITKQTASIVIALVVIATISATSYAGTFDDSYSKAKSGIQRINLLWKELKLQYAEKQELVSTISNLTQEIESLKKSNDSLIQSNLDKDEEIHRLQDKLSPRSYQLYLKCDKDYWEQDKKGDKKLYSSSIINTYNETKKQDCIAGK